MVGYPLAAVVATDRQLARDAVDLIEVDYEPLPTITIRRGGARRPRRRCVFAEFGTNLAYTVTRSGRRRRGAELAKRRSALQLRVQHSSAGAGADGAAGDRRRATTARRTG